VSETLVRFFFALLLLVLVSSPRAARSDISSGAEAAIGGGVFVAGYGMGTAPAILGSTRDSGGFNRPTNADAQSLIPVVGPMVWWFQANDRINERIAYRKAHPCQSDEPFSCMDFSGVDSVGHLMFAFPWMLVSSAAQAGGVGVLLHSVIRAAAEPDKRPTKERSLWLVPGPSGVGVAGTF